MTNPKGKPKKANIDKQMAILGVEVHGDLRVCNSGMYCSTSLIVIWKGSDWIICQNTKKCYYRELNSF